MKITYALIGLGLLTTSAHGASLTGSSPGYHYFWKAGAAIGEHDGAVIDCAVRTRAMINGSDAGSGVAAATGAAGGFAGGLVGGLIVGIIAANEARQGAAANVENCMALKGWSVVALPFDEGEAIRDLDDPAPIREKLAPLTGAAEPQGPVLRGPYANELAAGKFLIGPAQDLDKLSLSVRATRPAAEAAEAAAGKLTPPKPDLPKGVKAPKAIRGLKSEALASADAAKSYVVLRFSGAGRVIDGAAVTLSRLAPDGSEVVHDGAPTTVFLGLIKGKRFQRVEDAAGKHNDHVVDVPPGRWKLATVSMSAFDADLCFGAPAFEIGAGETIWLGDMTLADSGGYPLDASILADARAILAANPAIAERATAPEWTNGFTADCFGSYAYAYDVPGAPFVDRDAEQRGAEPAEEAPAVTTPLEEPAL